MGFCVKGSCDATLGDNLRNEKWTGTSDGDCKKGEKGCEREISKKK